VLAIVCPDRARQRGFAAEASPRCRATCCAIFSSTMWKNSATRAGLLHAAIAVTCPPDRADALELRDATNLSIHERRQWIKMAKSFGYEVQAVFFDVPLEVCLQRNSQRDRSVSEDIMRKMGEKLKPPVFEEGFEKITVVRVKSAS